MTIEQRLERDLPSHLGDIAMGPYPEYIDDVLSITAARRQRPGWTFPERWIPVELVTQRVPATRMPWRQLGVLALIAILISVALAVYIGSQPHLPPPFGLARNGVVTFVTSNDDIAIADPSGTETDVVVAGPDQDAYPTFSLDGTRIAFLRPVTGGRSKVMVVGLDDRRPVEVADVQAPAGLLQWSPDGSMVTVVSNGVLTIAKTDGSGARELDVGMPVDSEVEWRPPDGKELVVRLARDGAAGLFLVGLDGSSPRAITPTDGTGYDYLWLTWSPDGKRLAYSNYPAREVHILDVDSTSDRNVKGDVGVGLMFPRWSPDGTRLSVMTWLQESPFLQVGVLPVDDPTPHVTLTGPRFTQGIQHDWSPDGTVVFATEWGSNQPWLLDPEGGPAKEPAWDASFPDWVEWQRLAN